MKCISTHSLLYLQTAFSTNVETYIQYEHYNIHLPCSPEKHYIIYWNYIKILSSSMYVI